MFSFPWHSGARNEKALSEQANFVPTKQPMTQMPLFNKLKRKREDSNLTSAAVYSLANERSGPIRPPQLLTSNSQGVSQPDSDRNFDQPMVMTSPPLKGNLVAAPVDLDTQNQSNQGTPLGSIVSHNGPDHRSRGSRAEPVSASTLRDTIEAQFGLEILLKHKELRLIDQEYAKCQAGLEQLRRCQVIPYPTLPSNPEGMLAATSESGPAFDNSAPYAPPWGVTDGPYSRHYQRWLLPDSAFDDSARENTQTPVFGGKTVPERATRGSTSELGTGAGTLRSQRGSNGARLKALPHGYPEPKQVKGPMIVKRGSDGKMVKLVCLNCRRSNFNSAQGFINHCRIAHSRQFLSHDAAIEASGEEVDVDAEGGVGELNNGSQATASSALVHPLIRSSGHLARTPPSEASKSSTPEPKRSQAGASTSSQRKPSERSTMPSCAESPRHSAEAPFVPSPQTPHISALFARLGRGGDLDDMVKEAKERSDLSIFEECEDDEGIGTAATGVAANGTPTKTASAHQNHSTRGVPRGSAMPSRCTKSPPASRQTSVRHVSSIGSQRSPYLPNLNIHQPYPSPYHSDDVQEDHNHTVLNGSSPFNLSPNTIEAHTAPSLVSDDEDYENTHSESESPSLAGADDDDDHYIHAQVVDHDDMDLGEGSSAAHHLNLGGKPQAPNPRRRSSIMEQPVSLGNHDAEQRHVSFASSGRRPRRDSRPAGDK